MDPRNLEWGGRDAVLSQCVKCRHWETRGVCKAFPEGVPHDILANKFDHTQPHAGDHGIRFEYVVRQ